MVRCWNSVLLCIFLLSVQGLAADVRVAVKVDSSTIGENAPIYPLVQVTRSAGQEIDVNTFQLGDQALEVQFMGDQSHSSFTIINGTRSSQSFVISTYRFKLDGKPSGLHVVPPVSVEVDGVRYKSSQTAFSIQAAQASGDFRLDALVEGDQPFFPGRQLTLVYKIYFRRDIELTLQELPSPDASAFRAIGSQDSKTYREAGFYVQEIRQSYQILTPGTFQLNPAIIEGYAYEEDFFGRRKYQPPRLRAEAEGASITVEPFPQEGKPPTFNGAVGDFTIQTRLLSSNNVGVGDKMELEVTVYGAGDLETLSLPDIARQEGFRGNFRLSDLPPSSEIQGRSKRFVVELRPLAPEVKSIPAIQFSFFNPKLNRYVTVDSSPIGIQVAALPDVKSSDRPARDEEQRTLLDQEGTPEQEETWTGGFDEVQSIRIAGNYSLTEADLQEDTLQSPQVIYIVPLGLVLILIQSGLRQGRSRKKPERMEVSAQDLYLEALKNQDQPEVLYPLIEQVLLRRLYETGHTETLHESASNLARGGLLGDVRSFLTLLEAQRFSGKKLLAHDQVMTKAKSLFDRIR